MPWTTCPLCNKSVLIHRQLDVEGTLFCPHCDCLLQVVSLEPPEVDFPFRLSMDAEDPKRRRRSRRNTAASKS